MLAHPWTWLNEPQHSAAIQSLVALTFGLPTLILLWMATYAALMQARAAKAQTRATEFQTKELLRPHLLLNRKHPDKSWKANDQVLYIRNEGPGAAEQIQVHFIVRNNDGIFSVADKDNSPFVLPARASLFLAFPVVPYEDILIRYNSILGDQFATITGFFLNDTECNYLFCDPPGILLVNGRVEANLHLPTR